MIGRMLISRNEPRTPCPNCGARKLFFFSGDYPTGVVAPDGVREMRYEEGYKCYGCQGHFELSDLEEAEDDESTAEPN